MIFEPCYYKEETSFDDILKILKDDPGAKVCKGIETCWWMLWPSPFRDAGGRMCGPRQEMISVFQLGEFIRSRHFLSLTVEEGEAIFMAAYNGNVRHKSDNKPTSFEDWGDYIKVMEESGYDPKQTQ